MTKYPFARLEEKWQKYWDEHGTFRVTEDTGIPPEKRRYILDMFPYPSSQGLHIGHPEGYTATDIYCRYLRARGYNVLHPMGFDSFGLPAENYAIKTGTHPAATTAKNIEKFRQQLKRIGFSYDWEREISTSNSDYYRWTQWIFLKLFERGLAYEAESPINWCPSCKTGLANEEVKDGSCERCGTPVTRRRIRQWILKITDYADRLLEGLAGLDWPEPVKLMQRNWIGRSEGANVLFKIPADENIKNEISESVSLEIYTTRPDTLFGATYIVIAPEHPLVKKITAAAQKKAVDLYVESAAKKSDLERTSLAKTKTGAWTGAYAINPVNGKHIPIWVADYVLAGYGTGAIMAVPAHDERDWEFAKTFNLPVIEVVKPGKDMQADGTAPFTGEGISINSGDFSGLATSEVKKQIVAWLKERSLGEAAVQYKLRDWIFSRQRYWGEPIPIVHCPKCGNVPVPESELPLKLPEVESYKPSGSGESPLANIDEWVNTSCPRCGAPAKRETNTMPQWAGSCWYYLRYLDPHNNKEFVSRDKADYWAPVDLYVGGAEHAVLHLLYSRFWHKVLFDLGLVNTDEPFKKLINQGMILGEDNQKMSKSRGNVINPDVIINESGADALRLYIMFMGPLEVSKPWITSGIAGVERFLERLWHIGEKISKTAKAEPLLVKLLHKTIAKVTADTDSLKFNTAISAMMIYSAELSKLGDVPVELFEPFVIMLSPYTPHLAEELWEKLGRKEPVSCAVWPEFDNELASDDEVTVVVQINGKLRDKFSVNPETSPQELEKRALSLQNVQKWLNGKSPAKIITVPGKLVNIVVK
ncbi:MAG: leucine--tRNA ligase [Spirochaetaceae bacterium]|jgi:leucyl-tRNA synthetase|nr:leucine--tRNA ligase [Spirochaetaceae bacterium]